MTAVAAPPRPVAEGEDEIRVPWVGVVLPLAVLLALADDFWVISIRTSVGAVERTSQPFASWLRESSVALPLFVLALVLALGLARRWSGDRPRGLRPVLVTALLVVVAATAAGTLGLAASAAYDYHLQAVGLADHSVAHGTCLGECLAGRQQASFDLQVKAVAFGSLILLATNLLLVGWLVALRGGRLEPSLVRRPDRTAGRAEPTRADDVASALVGVLVAAAVVHVAVIPEHLAEWPAAGGFFVVLACAELGAAGLVRRRRDRRALLGVAAVSVGPIAVWAWSRTLGLPFGPEPGVPEPVGLADLVVVALEVSALTLALVLAWRRSRATAPPALSAHARGAVLVAVVAAAALGVGGSGVAGLALVPGPPTHEAGSGPVEP